ncbi:putative multicopper oxidase family protein [Lyophyllum shimeji]|uniref:laccase n=1 Tax=Lyophyllum shimeji TaxID=47721 RepID=A0A9P3PUE4_LYOSH|nr:putative multicopper oxidase family protein [Lyophyllum shimeji]
MTVWNTLSAKPCHGSEKRAKYRSVRSSSEGDDGEERFEQHHSCLSRGLKITLIRFSKVPTQAVTRSDAALMSLPLFRISKALPRKKMPRRCLPCHLRVADYFFRVFPCFTLGLAKPLENAALIYYKRAPESETTSTLKSFLGRYWEQCCCRLRLCFPSLPGPIAPDGFSRSAVLAGGAADSVSFPGPLIKGNKGDRFQLNVIDSLTDGTMLKSTSIHWHGLFQRGSGWADGPVGVNQCPIAPGNSFLYDFTVPDQAGTFWYHSHYSTQYCDGLRGALVVYDPADPHASLYDVDDDSTIITLADWYHVPAPSAGLVPTSDSTLINGLGRYPGGPTSPLAVINVVSGKRYRFRLVSISCDPNYVFSIDGHTMNIIEVDGVNVTPLTVDSIQIFAGQRYSFVLTANQPVGNYWIRAKPNVALGVDFTGGINSAILRYSGAAVADPTTTSTSSNPMLETNLHPLENPGAPGAHQAGGADVSLNLAIAFAGGKFTVNGATFAPPTAPVLLQIMSGARTAADLLPAGSVYPLPPNKVIEISIPGGTVGSPHPFHLHGHTFDVIRSAGSSVYNYDNPVRRDVVSIGGSTSDNVTIRFTTDNPGPWIMHCHIDWHLEIGLAVVFAEDPDTVSTMSHPAAWDELCPIYDALPTSDH